MDNKLYCDKHGEQIKTLFKRVDDVEDLRNVIHNLDKNMAVQTLILQEIKEHNDKQDKRLEEQHQTIVKINENLTELNEGQRNLNKRVGKLEKRVNENDEKNIIDLREINKKKYIDMLYKIVVPTGVGAVLFLEIMRYIK